MYDQYYGLQGRPFQLTPDPHFYFESATHRKALSYLGYGLAQGEGFIVITGDIGAGKTTLVGHLMNTIDPARLTAVKIVSTQVEGDDMLRLAAQSFGVSADGAPKAQLLQRIEAFLHAQARAGRRTLLIVDEAQNLPVSAIEELRMLSNFQLGGQALLQIFLLGQPEFRDLLKSPELEQLRQRVIATHHLEPMMAQEVEPYILHRLSVVDWDGNPAFTQDAFAAIYAATSGVPRRVNALASRVLLMGAIDRLALIDQDVVHAVVADMGIDSEARPEPVPSSLLDAVDEPVSSEPALERQPMFETDLSPDADPSIEAESVVDIMDEVDPVVGEPAYMAARHIPEPPEYDDESAFGEQRIFLQQPDLSEPLPVDAHVHDSLAVAERDPVEEAPVAQEPDPIAEEPPAYSADVLAEIAALRAELAALRTAPPVVGPVDSLDIDALVSHFNVIEQRLNGIEDRAREQDTALRRVLSLLVDWVEREERMLDTQNVAA